MLYQQISSRHSSLLQEEARLKRQLASFPEGKLICTSNGDYVKWYQSDGHSQTYIPKKNRALAERLAHKKFLTLRLETIQKELRALSFYLRHHDSEADDAYLSLLTTPGYAELLSSSFQHFSTELDDWMQAPYDKNPLYPDALIHPAPNNLFMRSKSEALIATMLHSHNIPFRYEAALYFPDGVYYPDFTIRHPDTGAYYYWEHFGLMDDAKYCQRTGNKITQYAQNGIIPTIQLITTYETKQHPLSFDVVKENIERYFL